MKKKHTYATLNSWSHIWEMQVKQMVIEQNIQIIIQQKL